jgi:hypothetical protein
MAKAATVKMKRATKVHIRGVYLLGRAVFAGLKGLDIKLLRECQ